MKSAMKYLTILISTVGLTACTQAFKPQTSALPTPVPTPAAQPVKAKGAIWSDASSSGNLFSDVRAVGLNDIVTILVEETSSASGKADTKTGRDNSLELGVDNFLGQDLSFGFNKSFFGLGGAGPFSPSVGASSSSAFKGTGSTTRSGSLKGVITARVIEVLPNGNLVVRGTREMVVNDEKQTMALTGVIRPQDISSSNTISSMLVADARIEYGGNGIVADQQEQGWLARVLGWVWPF
ncbi:MAG: flagellar basal body L-ring protein FlgH [Nitrospirota bacterium]|nr:flagellar basal body L-ring protein FlgH [Nitrospirota bacterium]